MSLDKSLVSKQLLRRHRNVLSRSERILRLEEEEKWEEGESLFGLPKVKNMKAKRRSKGAEKKEEEAAAALAEGVEAGAEVEGVATEGAETEEKKEES